MEKDLHDFLIKTQNSDGGWGYFPEKGSAYEPAAVSMMALRGEQGTETAMKRALRFFQSGQTSLGGWPGNLSAPEPEAWVTSIVVFALREMEGTDPVCRSGAGFVINRFVRTPLPWLLRLKDWLGNSAPNELDSSLRGWGWNQGTANWVEPTCYALMMINKERDIRPEADFASIVSEAENMLYNRMCKAGGWNYGNSRVLGQDLRPYPMTTALALVALQRNAGRAENQKSLLYLRGAAKEERSALGLCYSALCLDTYGQEWRSLLPELNRLYQETQFFGNILSSALALLVLKAERGQNLLKLKVET